MVSAAEAAKTVPVISVILLRFYKNAQGCQSGIHRNIDEGCLAVTKMQKKHRADAKTTYAIKTGFDVLTTTTAARMAYGPRYFPMRTQLGLPPRLDGSLVHTREHPC